MLNGTKLFIPDAHVSDTIVVVARTPGSEGDDGVSMFLVPGNAEGLSTTVLQTIAADKQCEVKLDGVRVGADDVLGPAGEAWQIIEIAKRYYTVAYCAYLVGLAQRDFEISVDYAKERIQFGRPIGSFQAIQHKAADMITDVDGSRFIMYRAAWAVTESEPDADLQVAMAKAWCSDATRRVVAHGQQIHGGIGFTKEYIIQLYFRRQKMAELMWGDADHHRREGRRPAQHLGPPTQAATSEGALLGERPLSRSAQVVREIRRTVSLAPAVPACDGTRCQSATRPLPNQP